MEAKKKKIVWSYQATIGKVKDGDTILCDIDLSTFNQLHETFPDTELIDLGFSLIISKDYLPLILTGSPLLFKEESIRLFGINAPEKNTDAGKTVMEFVQKLLPIGCVITLETIRVKSRTQREKYGRYLGKVLLPDGRCLNDMLLEQNLATPLLF